MKTIVHSFYKKKARRKILTANSMGGLQILTPEGGEVEVVPRKN